MTKRKKKDLRSDKGNKDIRHLLRQQQDAGRTAGTDSDDPYPAPTLAALCALYTIYIRKTITADPFADVYSWLEQSAGNLKKVHMDKFEELLRITDLTRVFREHKVLSFVDFVKTKITPNNLPAEPIISPTDDISTTSDDEQRENNEDHANDEDDPNDGAYSNDGDDVNEDNEADDAHDTPVRPTKKRKPNERTPTPRKARELDVASRTGLDTVIASLNTILKVKTSKNKDIKSATVDLKANKDLCLRFLNRAHNLDIQYIGEQFLIQENVPGTQADLADAQDNNTGNDNENDQDSDIHNDN